MQRNIFNVIQGYRYCGIIGRHVTIVYILIFLNSSKCHWKRCCYLYTIHVLKQPALMGIIVQLLDLFTCLINSLSFSLLSLSSFSKWLECTRGHLSECVGNCLLCSQRARGGFDVIKSDTSQSSADIVLCATAAAAMGREEQWDAAGSCRDQLNQIFIVN